VLGVKKSDVKVVLLQFIVMVIPAFVSAQAIKYFFSPLNNLIEFPLLVISYFISTISISAFFTAYERQEDIFVYKYKFSDHFEEKKEKGEDFTAVDVILKAIEVTSEAKADFKETAMGVFPSAVVLLFLIKISLLLGDIAGLPTEGTRLDISSAFTSVIYIVAIYGILFKSRKIENE
jgi:hypothetical protein